MKSPTTSFISEHTAEYILVPDLVRRLRPHFQNIIPMYFWGTREGGAAASRMMRGVSVRLLAAFARRPKISSSEPDLLTMKVNQEVFDYTRTSLAMGIPVIAGIPVVPSLLSFKMDSPCCWFDLDRLSSSHDDYFLKLALDGSVASTIPPRAPPLPEPLHDSDLLNLAKSSKVYPWDVAVGILTKIRHSRAEFSRFPFFSGYKPFHLILTS